jgi:hypothetical protein
VQAAVLSRTAGRSIAAASIRGRLTASLVQRFPLRCWSRSPAA